MKLKGLLMIVVMVPLITLAQEKRPRNEGTPEENAKRMTEHMNEKLALSEEQYQAILDINLGMTQEMQSFIEETEQERNEMRMKAKEIHDDRDALLKEVLDEDQWNQFLAMKEERKSRTRERKRGEK